MEVPGQAISEIVTGKQLLEPTNKVRTDIRWTGGNLRLYLRPAVYQSYNIFLVMTGSKVTVTARIEGFDFCGQEERTDDEPDLQTLREMKLRCMFDSAEYQRLAKTKTASELGITSRRISSMIQRQIGTRVP